MMLFLPIYPDGVQASVAEYTMYWSGFEVPFGHVDSVNRVNACKNESKCTENGKLNHHQ